MRVESVTSASNPKIKNLLLLQEKSKARKEQGLFVVEGRRELEHCLSAGFTVRTLFVCPEIADGLTEEGVVSQISGHPRPDKREGPAGEASGRGREATVGDSVSATLTPQIIRQTIIDIRNAKLPDPAVTGSAGSFFCNPVISREHFERIKDIARQDNGPDYQVPHYEVGDQIKVPAAWMIEQCGFKGKRLGGAQVYQNQPLVIVNASGEASPEEIIGLETEVIQAIETKYGITLHPEVEHV